MTDVAVLISDMVRAGVDPDLIGRAAAALAEREPVKVIDEQAERKRAADRERMRRIREENRATSRDVAVNPSPKEKSPLHPPKEITPSQSVPEASASSTDNARSRFAAFWSLYPHKVGKAAAEASFSRALRKTSFEALMAGLRAYVAKTDDRPWCNPATWLNQGRWDDAPALPQARGSPQQRTPSQADVFAMIGRRLEENGQAEKDSDSAGTLVSHLPAARSG